MDSLNTKIIGAGPTGTLMALSLASLGMYVDVFDNIPINILIKNDRSYALTHSSRRFFEIIDIWNDIESVASPFNSLLVNDSSLNMSTSFNLNDLSVDNQKYKAIGWIIEHNSLMNIIIQKLSKSKYIKVINKSTSILDNDNYTFNIAADGKCSLSRKNLDIPYSSFRYSQGCISFKVLLRGAYPLRAYEVLREEGPLAILPIKGDIYQIVWSSSLSVCHKRMQLSRSLFLDALCSALPRGIDPDSLINEPRLSPLDFLISFNFSNSNNILLGESAHSLHPVGGQGLNLSIRDINQLRILFTRKKNLQYLRPSLSSAFNRSRLLDTLFISFFTDSIVRLFSNRNPLLLFLRKIIFAIFLKIKYIRVIILSIMTDGI